MTIRCIHLLSRPTDDRERLSISQLTQLSRHGIDRIEIVNAPWTGEVPQPRDAPDRPFRLTPAHYGCWKAHRDGIADHMDGVDALLVCECDCIPVGSMVEFAAKVRRAAEACRDGDLDAFTLGHRHNGQIIDRVGDDVIVITQWIGTHCYLVPAKSKAIFTAMFAQPWDAYDYCTTVYLYDQQKRRIGAFADRSAAVQADGKSLISGLTVKTAQHYKTATNVPNK